MSPVAITNDRRESTPPQPFRPLPHDALNIARHPSPWHEIAHTLSTTPSTSVSSRRGSSPTPYTTPLPITSTKPDSTASPIHSALSSSQALRDWEARLASPDSDVRRHQLVHPPSTSQLLIPVRGSPVLPPKLAAERDKEGHIEYKLKLIDPSVERFGKLVTQMMWRLKQGKNEAIYEIGLADDGTVVGLTRAEMDASLKTLEAMASELGATVMILREIVLSGAPPSNSSPSISSSFVSTSSAQSIEYDSAWPVKRPDLDDLGRPKKGTRALSEIVNDGEKPKVVKRASRDILPQYKARQVVFDIPADPDEGDSDASISSPSQTTKETPHGFDDDIPPFELDLEDSVPPPGRRHKKKVVSEQMQIDPKKFDAKRAKLAKRREERRMDLLRGDGMSTTWLDTQPPPNPGLTSQLLAKIPHQPARPSSLRLASPAPSTSTIRPSHNGGDEDGSLWGLSETPLDSLSLSFADVQIQDISPSPSESPTHAPTGLGLELSNASRPITGKEMVCVEALVVRKVQHGHGVDGDGSEEEECGWGGQDDVWGLGVDSD